MGSALLDTKNMAGPTANESIGPWPPASCNLYQPLDAKQSDIYVGASISDSALMALCYSVSFQCHHVRRLHGEKKVVPHLFREEEDNPHYIRTVGHALVARTAASQDSFLPQRFSGLKYIYYS